MFLPIRNEDRHYVEAESLLTRDALMDSGMLDPAPIRARWQAHCAGKLDASQALWGVLAFQAWYRRWQAAPESRDRLWHAASA